MQNFSIVSLYCSFIIKIILINEWIPHKTHKIFRFFDLNSIFYVLVSNMVILIQTNNLWIKGEDFILFKNLFVDLFIHFKEFRTEREFQSSSIYFWYD